MPSATVPMDVEQHVIDFLYARGVNASPSVPEERAAGMVRVQRTGGVPKVDGTLDQPVILVEVWGSDRGDSFDRAVTIYAHFTLASNGEGIPGLYTRSIEPTPPVSFADPLAPELHRHQFTVAMVCTMGTMEVTTP